MGLKHWTLFLTAAALLLGAGQAMATGTTTHSTTPAKSRELPVLVKVDNHGKVTTVDPSSKLSPQLQQLLHKTLAAMITKPAHDKHGKPISSQFVINMNMQSTPLANGTYGFKFTYVSAKPVPSGSWYWVHSPDNRHVSLVNQAGANGMTYRNQVTVRNDMLSNLAVKQANHPQNSSSNSGSH